MIVTAYKNGQNLRIPLWTLGPGKPTLHVGEDRIEVETVTAIKEILKERGYDDVRVYDPSIFNYDHD